MAERGNHVSDDARRPSYAAGAAALMLGGGTLLGLALTLRALIPADAPKFSNPGFVDAVFDSRFAITCARLVLFVATIYLIVSMVALIVRRRWLVEAGPFKTSGVDEAVATLKQERDDLDQSLTMAIEVIDDLEAKLKKVETELAAARDRLAN